MVYSVPPEVYVTVTGKDFSVEGSLTVCWADPGRAINARNSMTQNAARARDMGDSRWWLTGEK
jgi:hypothetical protein